MAQPYISPDNIEKIQKLKRQKLIIDVLSGVFLILILIGGYFGYKKFFHKGETYEVLTPGEKENYIIHIGGETDATSTTVVPPGSSIDYGKTGKEDTKKQAVIEDSFNDQEQVAKPSTRSTAGEKYLVSDPEEKDKMINSFDDSQYEFTSEDDKLKQLGN